MLNYLGTCDVVDPAMDVMWMICTDFISPTIARWIWLYGNSGCQHSIGALKNSWSCLAKEHKIDAYSWRRLGQCHAEMYGVNVSIICTEEKDRYQILVPPAAEVARGAEVALSDPTVR